MKRHAVLIAIILCVLAGAQTPIRREWTKVIVPVGGELRCVTGKVLFEAPSQGVYAEVRQNRRADDSPAGTKIYRFDKLGNVVWTANSPGRAYATDEDFNLYFQAVEQVSPDESRYRISKLGVDGRLKWTTPWVTTKYGSPVSTSREGYTAFTFTEGQTGVVRYISPAGGFLWDYRLEPDIVTGVYNSFKVLVNEGNDVFVGGTYWFEAVRYRTEVHKLDQTGFPLWTWYDHDTAHRDYFFGPVSDRDGGVFFHYTEVNGSIMISYSQVHVSREGVTAYQTSPVATNLELQDIRYVQDKVVTDFFAVGTNGWTPSFGIYSAVNGALQTKITHNINTNWRRLHISGSSLYTSYITYREEPRPDGNGTYSTPDTYFIGRYTLDGVHRALYTGVLDSHEVIATSDGAIWNAGAMLGYNTLPWLREGFRLTKLGQNALPKPDSFICPQTHRTQGSVLENDDFAGGGRAELVMNVANGRLTLDSDGTFYYIPNDGFLGTDRFTYRVVKPNFVSAPAVVTLTVPAIFRSMSAPASVTGGNVWNLNLNLNYTVGIARGTAELTASSPEVVVPPRVTLVEGLESKVIPIPTRPVAYDVEVGVSVRLGGVTKQMFVIVKPAKLAALTLSASMVRGGTSLTGSVAMDGKAPTGGTEITLASSRTSAVVPASVTVAAGAAGASFPITTSGVVANTAVTISALQGTLRKTAILTLTPPDVVALLATPSTVRSGANVVFTVTLSNKAPGGISVALSSSHTSLPVPIKMTVPANSLTASFTVRAGLVTGTQAVQVTATRGTSRTVTVTVQR